MKDTKTLRKLYDEHVSKSITVNFPHFVAEARGARVRDVEGREFLDLTGGIGVTNLGHGHESVARALGEQLERYLHLCFTVQMYEPLVLLAKRLAAIMPPGLTKSAFFNSGAEALENAVKISRSYTGRRAVVTFENSFHGRTFLTLAMTGKLRPYKFPFGSLVPDVHHVPFPYPYRWEGDPDDCSAHSIDALRRLFHSTVPAREVACIAVEPIQGEGGFVVPPPDFFPLLRELCDEEGILLVDDEVQSGLGRTGRWNAIDHFDVRPDLVATGKALGGGLPLSGVTGPPEVMDHPPVGSIGGTFGGNPLSCVAGLAAIDAIEELLPRVRELETRLVRRLDEWVDDFPLVGEARGLGAMQAIELVRDEGTKEPAPKEARALKQACYERNLLVLTCGYHDNVIRFHPPFTMEWEDLDRALDAVEEGLKAVAGS